METWLLCFLTALVGSLVYGYWLGGYARRHAWSEDHVRRRAAMVPYCAGAAATLGLVVVRLETGKGWAAEGSLGEVLFWVLLGFLLGGGLTMIIVMRRIRPQ